MPGRRRKHVDPIRVHLITLVIFGVIAGAALAVWTFPKFFFGLVLLAVSAVVYVRLYAFIEDRLEAEEGRLAEDLGFGLEEDDEEVVEEAPPKPKRKRARKAKVASPPSPEGEPTLPLVEEPSPERQPS